MEKLNENVKIFQEKNSQKIKKYEKKLSNLEDSINNITHPNNGKYSKDKTFIALCLLTLTMGAILALIIYGIVRLFLQCHV